MEVIARAYIDTAQVDLFVQNQRYFQCRRLITQHAYLGYNSGNADCTKGTPEGTRTADFDHQVCAAAAGLVDYPLIPIRVLAVVHAGVETELPGSLEFLAAA